MSLGFLVNVLKVRKDVVTLIVVVNLLRFYVRSKLFFGGPDSEQLPVLYIS